MNQVDKNHWTPLTIAWIVATLLCGCSAAAALPTEAPPPTVDLTAVACATPTPYPTATPTPFPTATATATTGPISKPVDTPTRPANPAPPSPGASQPDGTENLVGYYRLETQTVWESTKQCDQLVILNRNALVDKYVGWVKGGNNVNSIDDAGHLVAILDLSVLSNEAQDTIKRSNASKIVAVRVRERPEGGSGAPVCYSVFIIVDVE